MTETAYLLFMSVLVYVGTFSFLVWKADRDFKKRHADFMKRLEE